MFHRIALFKLTDANATDATRSQVVRALRAALDQRGYEASVGIPADEASSKSWDLSMVVKARTVELAHAFDPSAFLRDHGALPDDAVAVVKTWVFEG